MSRFLVKKLPAKSGLRRKVLKNLESSYDIPYGTIIESGGNSLVLLSDERLPDFYNWFWKNIPNDNAICIVLHEKLVMLMVWEERIIRLCGLKRASEVSTLIAHFSPDIPLFTEQGIYNSAHKQAELGLSKLNSERIRCTVIAEVPAFRTIKSLRPPGIFHFTLPLTGLVVVALLYGKSSSPTPLPEMQENPFSQLETSLSGSPGRISPLLRLDFNYSQLMSGLPGWHVRSVEYGSSGLIYQLDRDFGTHQSVHKFALSQNLLVQMTHNQITLHKQIHLPVVFDELKLSELVSLQQLIAVLADRLSLWIPGMQLSPGALTQHHGWISQLMQLQFVDIAPSDLLSLAGLLEGLPLKFEHGKYRVSESGLSGNILVTLYGVNG